MGQALVGAVEEAFSPALREGRDLGRPRYGPPVGTIKEVDLYTPDETVYEVDQANSPVRKFFDLAQEGKCVVEAHLLKVDGSSVTVHLNEHAVKAALEEHRLGDVAAEVLREGANAFIPAGDVDGEERLVEDDDDPDDDEEAADPLAEASDEGQGPMGDEFLPLGNGPFNQQLYLYDLWDMLAKCFWAASHDPVAKSALEIIVDFVLGRGFQITAADPLMQDEWEAFWKLNHGDERFHMWLYDWFRDGENFTRFFPQVTRPPKIAMLEPSTILEIITDPENIDDVVLYWQQYQTAMQLYTSGEMPAVKYIIRQIPAADVIHSKINAAASEKRGRSDLFCVLGWLKRLRDYYNAETLKAIVQAAFGWDFTLKGSAVDVAAVNSYAASTPPPDLQRPGQAFYHNDAVEVKPLQADKASTSTGSIGVGDGLLGIIALGMNIVKDYLGVTSRGSRATALVAETPTVKHIESRQKLVRHYIERVAEKVGQIAIEEGRLPKMVLRANDETTIKAIIVQLRRGNLKKAFRALRDVVRGGVLVPIDLSVSVKFAPIVSADRTKTIADAERAESDQYISKRRAAQIVANAFDADDYDYEEEQAEIAAEPRTTMIAKTGAQVVKGAPQAGAPAFNPGEVVDPDASGGDDQDDDGRSKGDDNPAGAGAAQIRGDLSREGKLRRAARKTISFIFDDR
ncbi:MAG: phage portal protein [Vulcanimicrobiaceae bacterium]|jgi:hypothetical protein